MNASPERTALLQQAEEVRAKAMRRAVDDVMFPGGEERSLHAVAKARGVPEGALREALHARGWTPPSRIRQRRSRAKQLPQPRSDNQT